MDPRERWQALQAQLTTARALFEAGDRAKALQAVDAALAIDPNFLAAHSLRERIRSAPAPAATVPAPSPAVPLVSPDGYAKFELRAKRRRVDRRIDAARAALERGRFRDAAAALEEVVELDPNLPEVQELTAKLLELRRSTTEHHHGRWLAAAAAFVAVMLGASYLQEAGSLWSRSMVDMAPLVAPPEPAATTVLAASAAASDDRLPAADEPVATTGADVARPDQEPEPVPFERIDRLSRVPDVRPADRALEPTAPAIAAPAPAVARPVQDIPTQAVAINVPPPPPPPVAPPPPATAASAAPAPIVPTVDDEGLVKQVLQRYRSAYEGLDARSAHAVWPLVNEPALARAFSGLESQTLTFDACDVRLHGEAALATCHGSARYVPKVGSREPRVEPRVWNFTLKKSGADWTIETARAER